MGISSATDDPTRSSGFRPEIQALRALAVAVVVVYHFWPHILPGGFIGVDVFFLISGFLITSHLLREWEGGGRISLSRFWARRARRLLPASLIVLAVVAIATPFVVPGSQWPQVYREIVASALYVENWSLARDSIDYLTAENLPTPVQHFWSLSAEEQFYLVWPILLLVASAVSLAQPVRRRRVALALLATVTLASFAYSIVLTYSSPGPAYFVTPARAWEFGAGGLLAFVSANRLGGRIRAAAAWAGWIGIVVVAMSYSAATPFPGFAAAAPLIFAGAIILAGRPHVRWAPNRVIATKPVVFLGDVSYATYLWHWPALLLGGYLLGERFVWWVKILVIVATIVVAWLTTRFVENPVRSLRPALIRKSRYTLIAAALAMAIVVVPSLVTWSAIRAAAAAEIAAAQAAAELEVACFGAGARDPDYDCDGVVYDHLTPDPIAAVDDKPDAYADGCITGDKKSDVRMCEIGDPDGAIRVAIVGDSHAIHWEPALVKIAQERGWSLTTIYKSACPHSNAVKVGGKPEWTASCNAWIEAVNPVIEGLEPFDLVFVSYSINNTSYESESVAIKGFRDAWHMFTDRGAEVVVLRDVPRMLDSTMACLESNEADPEPCDVPAAESYLPVDLMVEAAKGQEHVSVIDLTEYFCWSGTCKAAIGGVVVFRDTHHVTRTFAFTLAPYVARALDKLGIPAR
ncbi:MAG: acyltransferase family protein [Pseudolysinimonas sp.]